MFHILLLPTDLIVLFYVTVIFMGILPILQSVMGEFVHAVHGCPSSLGLIFFILGLQIFFQNIKVGGGKEIKIKNTKKFFLI